MKTKNVVYYLDEIKVFFEDEYDLEDEDAKAWNSALSTAMDKLSKYKDLKEKVKSLEKENKELKEKNESLLNSSVEEDLEIF